MSRAVRVGVGALMTIGGFMLPGPLGVYLSSAGIAMFGGALLEPRIDPFGKSGPQPQSIMVRSATEPQPVIYGRTKISGPLIWLGTSGHLLRYAWYAIEVCDADREIDGYEKLWIDEHEIDIASQVDENGYVTHPKFVNAAGEKLVWCKFYRGEQNQVANAELKAAFPNDWDDRFEGKGTAYFIVRLELDYSEGGNNPDNPQANVWYKGAPREIAVTVRGFRVYDPRKDSTNGGSGAHRENDPTTWEWSDNPALCIRDYLRDIYLGPGYGSASVPAAHYAAQANICDESVNVPNGLGGLVSQKRYTINGYQVTDSDAKIIVESMMTSCVGAYIDAEGTHRVFVGAWAAPEHDIDETWLAGGLAVEPAVSSDEMWNFVRGRYTSAAEEWQLVEYPPRASAAYEAADGGRRWPREKDLPWTTDPYTAQRLALIELKKSRNQMLLRLECNRKAMPVAEWDVCRVTIDALGFVQKTFRCIHAKITSDGRIALTLREEQASDWTYVEADLDEVSFGDPILREAARPPAPTGLTATTAPEGISLGWSTAGMINVARTEIYAAATNDRSAATLVARERGESWTHRLDADTVRYYWALNRGDNGMPSTWHPAGATDGVYGIAGAAGQGPPGDPGAPAIDGFVNVDGPASWVRAQDGTTWAPTATTTDVDWTFRLAGSDVARISRRVTRDAVGLLTVSTTTHPGGDLNTERVTITTTGGGTRAVTLRATYDHNGHIKTVVQGITASLSGTNGGDGLSVAEVYAYRRSAAAPTQPTGGAYNFTTHTLTPPSGWSVGIPAGADPVYVVVATAAIQGITGTDNALDWSSPVRVFSDGAKGDPGDPGPDGSGVDIIFRRSATQPATPDPSTGTPANWYSNVNSVPAGPDPIWMSVGKRADSTSAFGWQTPVLIEGSNGQNAISGALTNESHTVQANNAGGNYSLAGAGGTFWVWNGLSDVTGSGPTYSVVAPATKNGLTMSINATTGVYTLSGASWTSDEETFRLHAVFNGVTIPRDYSISKSKMGPQGFSAPLLHLQASSQQFRVGADGAFSPTSQTITFTATLQNLSGTASFVATRYNAAGTSLGTVTLGGSGNARTLTQAQFADAAYCVVTASLSGLSDTVTVVRSADGSLGLSVAELIIYRRSASAPATPTGGSFNFGTQVLTPPTNWSSTIPAGTDPVYTSRAVASVVGTTGVASSLTWTAPVLSFRDGLDGQAVDIIFRRSATQPATPASSSGVPANWYSNVNSVPAGPEPLWSSVGTRTGVGSNWTWQVAVQIEGQAAKFVTVIGDNYDMNLAGHAWRGFFLSTGYSHTSGSIGHTLIGYNPATDTITHGPTSYNTYGSGTAGLVAAINAIPEGIIVALYSQDANAVDAALRTALAQFGSGLSSTWGPSRVSHAFIGMRGFLPGQAYESHKTGAAATDYVREIAYFTDAGLVRNGKDGAPGLTHSISLADFGVSCDSAGNPRAGAFDGAVGAWQVISGTTDVTASTTFAIVASSNVTAQVNNTTNQNFTGPKGAYRVTGITADSGHFDMTATYGGSTVQRRVTVRKVKDGSPATTAQVASTASISSTTFVVISSTLSIPVGPTGTISASWSATYFGTSGTGSFQIVGKVQYRQQGSPTWIDMPGGETTGGISRYLVGDGVWEPGDISLGRSMSGPASPVIYEFQLLARKTSTAGGSASVALPRVFAVGWRP